MSAKSEKVHNFDYMDQFRMSAVPQRVPLTGCTNNPKPASQSLAANNDQAIVW